jgi:outer membrane protein TolC
MTGFRCLRLGGMTLVLLAAVLWAAVPAHAQAPAASLSLADAVRTTLDKAPILDLARQNVAGQQASVRVARGAFDSVFSLSPSFVHTEDSLAHAGTRDNEVVKREIAKALNRNFSIIAAAFADNIKNARADLPFCPADAGWSIFVVTLPGTATPVPICKPVTASLGVSAEGEFTAADVYISPYLFDPLLSYSLQEKLAGVLQVNIAVASGQIREESLELLYKFGAVANDVATRSGLAYERLGDVPTWQYSQTGTLVVDWFKPLRSGSAFQAQATWDGRGAMYRDKPLDPIFGGRDVVNRFRSRIEASWVQPLLRGRGADTVRAPERAAAVNVEAAKYTFEQTSADQALVTADAYFGLVAAQQSLAFVRESLQNQRRMLENTIKLVAAGEVASADVVRARARTAEVESNVEAARLAVVAAQARLATAMGVSAVEMTALAASDVFPARPLDLDMAAIGKDAVARRADIKAAAGFRDASRILQTAARAETRWRFDLKFSGGVGQAYYAPPFRSLPDELAPIGLLPADSYVRYYDPRGIGRAFSERWEPIATVTGTIQLPFGNNQRLGQYAQAVASTSASDIQVMDLRRTVENAVPQLADNVRRARLQWEQRQEQVIQYEATWDAAQRLRAAGEMTLIDTLLTEQELTQARLLLVTAKQEYASAVARFKRETGTLITFTDWTQASPNLAGLVAPR